MRLPLRLAVLSLACLALLLPFTRTDAATLAADDEMEIVVTEDTTTLFQLGFDVEAAAARGGSQRLGWRVFDGEGKLISGDLKEYVYAKGVHTEQQMINDADFQKTVAAGAKVFIWSTQVPCLYGAKKPAREACSVLLPRFIKANPKQKFFVGFKSMKLSQAEYKKMKDEDLEISEKQIIEMTRSSWDGVPNASVYVYQTQAQKVKGGKSRVLPINKFDAIFEASFIEVSRSGDQVKSADTNRLRVLRRLTVSSTAGRQSTVQPTSGTSSQKSQDQVVPNHKKILQAALEKGKNFKLSFVLGKEDGSVVGGAVEGVAVPKQLPNDVAYIAFYANPLTADVEKFVKVANEFPKHKVNVVFLKTQPMTMLLGSTLEQLLKVKPAQPNLRFFTLVGTNQIPSRIWPPKSIPAASPASPAAPAPKGKL